MSVGKKLIKMLFPLLALMMVAGCGSEKAVDNKVEDKAEDKQEHSTAASVHKAHWSYEGDTSPEHWAELDQLFTTCKVGKAQSPINILKEEVQDDESLSPIKVEYSPSKVTIVNNGHTIQANLDNKDNKITLEGKTYTLQQFHFHLPSEHEVNGSHADMELHFVHKDADGQLAVLSVLITKGSKENAELNKLWSMLPTEENEEGIPIEDAFDMNELLPEDLHSFRYQGSLTTPPCTEGVQWIVLENPVQWSEEQINKFKAIFPHDNRPVQPLGEREVDTDS
ncbi:MAG: carbonic anhydrase family protein [Paenibacillus sp.]|nr:carbonic anhydrase family protein [Paenibacillus sp.]